MATTKRGAGTGTGNGGRATRDARPRIRSSHDGAPVMRAGRPKPEGASGLRARSTPSARSTPEARGTRREGGPTKREGGPKPQVAIGPRTRKARPQPAPSPSSSIASDDARELAIAIAVAGLDKKAVGLEILDVAGKVDYADFLVLMTGRSDRQVSALAQGIEEALRRKNRRPLSVEGLQQATWILMDYGDVVVHVFQDDARSLYDIEGLWLDVRRIPIPVPEGLRGPTPS